MTRIVPPHPQSNLSLSSSRDAVPQSTYEAFGGFNWRTDPPRTMVCRCPAFREWRVKPPPGDYSEDWRRVIDLSNRQADWWTSHPARFRGKRDGSIGCNPGERDCCGPTSRVTIPFLIRSRSLPFEQPHSALVPRKPNPLDGPDGPDGPDPDSDSDPGPDPDPDPDHAIIACAATGSSRGVLVRHREAKPNRPRPDSFRAAPT